MQMSLFAVFVADICFKNIGKNEKAPRQTKKACIRIKKGGIGIDESESYITNDKKERHAIFNKVACPLFLTRCRQMAENGSV